MSVTLTQLRSFLALAEKGSFIAASEAIARSQPAVSTQIRNLETALGVPLVYRNNRQVVLTPEGRSFHARLRRTIGELDAIIEDVERIAALETGLISVGAAPTLAVFILPVAVRSFRTTHPGVHVRFSDENTPELERLVMNGDLDFYFGPRPPVSSPLKFRLVAEDEYVALVTADHPLSRRGSVPVEELAQEPWLLMKSGTSMRREVERFIDRHMLQVSIAEEVANHFTLGGMVAAGCGIAILPRTAVPLALQEGVVALRMEGAQLTRELGIANRADYVPSPAASAFIQTAVPLILEHSLRGRVQSARDRTPATP